MRLLAIESAGRQGSLALVENQVLINELQLGSDLRSAQSLPAGIARLMKIADWQATDIDLVAVTTGPGSFTGLRVGVTAAKCFAYTAGAQVVEVNTLHVLAQQAGEAHSHPGVVAALWDAQRGELFAQSFRSVNIQASSFEMEACAPLRLVQPEAWLDGLADNTLLVGPTVDRLPKHPDRLQYASSLEGAPAARTVARLATRGTPPKLEPFALVPRYFRLSAAEEKLRREG